MRLAERARVVVSVLSLTALSACGGAAISSTGSAGQASTTTELGGFSTTLTKVLPPPGWVAQRFHGDGLVVRLSVPPTWRYRLPATPGTPTWGGDFGFIGSFPLRPFCGSVPSGFGCQPRNAGSFPADGVTLDLGAYAPSGPIQPGQSEPGPALVRGQALYGQREDGHNCVGTGGVVSDGYTMPDGEVETLFTAVFCYSGPDLARLEATAARVVQTLRFSSDPASTAPPIKWALPQLATGTLASGPLPFCRDTQIQAAVNPVVATPYRDHTALSVATTYSAAGGASCGLPPPGTCGLYGAVGLFSQSGQPIWEWTPVTLGARCLQDQVDVLPLTITTPTWTFNSVVLPPGDYVLRAMSIGTPATVPPLGGPVETTVLLR